MKARWIAGQNARFNTVLCVRRTVRRSSDYLMIEGANKLKKIITLCGRPSPGLTIKFHDFSGLEINIVKFHDFLQVFRDMYRSTHAR